MRYFFSTGEASGELAAVVIARAIARHDPDAIFEGIGSSRMRDAGFTLWRDHTGWASLGPFAAVPRIPWLYATMCQTAAHIERTKPDAVVCVDFGAFNVRLARRLKQRLHFAKPILDIFPPSTWLDRGSVAHAVSEVAVPVTAFAHQYRFYKSLDLPIVYFGHPLAARYETRAPRAIAPADGGTIGLLPGSRPSELRNHLDLLLDAFERLRAARPHMHAIVGAADDAIAARVRQRLQQRGLTAVTVGEGVASIADCDAAFVASGTAVLETVLMGIPSIALYIVSPLLERYARRIYSGTYFTIPNLVMERTLVPEFSQAGATPSALAAAMEQLLRAPQVQTDEFPAFRRALGPPHALDDLARFTVALATTGAR